MHEFAHENLAPDHVFLALLLEGQRPRGIGHFVLTQPGAGMDSSRRELNRFLDSEESRLSIAGLFKGFLTFLPDKTIDLIDEAGSRYCIEKAGLPEPAKVFDRTLTRVLKAKNKAIQDKNFEEAEIYKDKEDDLRIPWH